MQIILNTSARFGTKIIIQYSFILSRFVTIGSNSATQTCSVCVCIDMAKEDIVISLIVNGHGYSTG